MVGFGFQPLPFHLYPATATGSVSRDHLTETSAPWPGGVPETNQVKLFVRYDTADGRKVQVQHDLILNPTAQASERWTPRAGGPRPDMPATPQVVTGPQGWRSLDGGYPPRPFPGVQRDLTKVTPPAASAPSANQVIQEPAAPQTNVAENPAPLLAPPPATQPARPQWQPFR